MLFPEGILCNLVSILINKLQCTEKEQYFGRLVSFEVKLISKLKTQTATASINKIPLFKFQRFISQGTIIRDCNNKI